MRKTFALVLLQGALAFAQTSGEHWMPTWVAAQQQPRAQRLSFNNQTVRMIVHTSVGGRRVRVQLSNAYGVAPLTIGAVHIAIRSKDSGVIADSDRPLLFNGKPSCTVPVGAFMVSDAVNLDVPVLGDLAVSIYAPGDTGAATTHALGLHTTYISKQGDVTGAIAIPDPATSQSWFFLSSVEVLAPADAAAIVTFGDSITGRHALDPEHGFKLAQLSGAEGGVFSRCGSDQGISANRVLRDGIG